MDVSEVVRAAGGIVTRVSPDGRTEVVVVHRAVYGDWTFPKGKADANETDEETAVREVLEETSLECRLLRELGTTRYHDSRGRPKEVRYWEMEAIGGELGSSHEVDDARWLRLETAREVLTYERDLDILDELESRATRVYLVRHAKAKNRAAWTGPDAVRPLTGAGWKQAEALVSAYSDEGFRRLLSSPATRCVQTLEPLAEATGLEIELAEELAEGAPARAALDILRAGARVGPLAACTHGDVLLDALVEFRSAGVQLDGPLEARKGSTWVLDVDAGGIRFGRYLEPPDASSRA